MLLLYILEQILPLPLQVQGFQVARPKSHALSPSKSTVRHPVVPGVPPAQHWQPKLSALKYMHGFHRPDFPLTERKTLWCTFLLPC